MIDLLAYGAAALVCVGGLAITCYCVWDLLALRSTGEPDKALRGAGGEQTPETGATQ